MVSNRFRHSSGFSERRWTANNQTLVSRDTPRLEYILTKPWHYLSFYWSTNQKPCSLHLLEQKLSTYKAARNRFTQTKDIWRPHTQRNPASYWSQSQKCDTVRTYLVNIRTMIEIHSILQGLRAALSYHTYITCNVQAYLQTWSESSVKSLVRFTSYTYTKRLSVIPNKYWRRVWASSSYSEN